MLSIDQLILQEINPFDEKDFKAGNFWLERQDVAKTVHSIHQEELKKIETYLDLMIQDQRSRTLLLAGEVGSGKSYFLGRLKQEFNPKAFFVYIEPWVDSRYLWRHILRRTVDSLIAKPEGQEKSQLLLWLQEISTFNTGGFLQWFSSDRKKFITHLKTTYPIGIYNSQEFFGVLYDLINPELYPIACDWLKGDDLAEEDLQILKVKMSIDSEDKAKNILGNFGRIAPNTKPLVLCFDQVDNIPMLSNNCLDLQALFNVNTNIHTQNLRNFMIIICLPTSKWQENINMIHPADLQPGRITETIRLKLINKEQVEALWILRLHSLHQKANSHSLSPIYPLSQNDLSSAKTTPRTALKLGRDLYQRYKINLSGSKVHRNQDEQSLSAAFQLFWQNEYQKNQQEIHKINLLTSPELIKLLEIYLKALEIKNIQLKLLKGKYELYSLSYQGKTGKIGVIWTEDPNMQSFYHIMKACKKVIQQNSCQKMYLLRNANLGNAKLSGYKIYQSIFTNLIHTHLVTNLIYIHYLVTYGKLVNAAKAHELVIAGKTISFSLLETLVRQTKILEKCPLLQDLEIFRNQTVETNSEIKGHLLNLVQSQGFIGLKTLIDKLMQSSLAAQVSPKIINDAVNELCQSNQTRITNPDAPLEQQLICYIPPK